MFSKNEFRSIKIQSIQMSTYNIYEPYFEENEDQVFHLHWKYLKTVSSIEEAKTFTKTLIDEYKKSSGHFFIPLHPEMNEQNSFTYIGHRQDCLQYSEKHDWYGHLGYVIEPTEHIKTPLTIYLIYEPSFKEYEEYGFVTLSLCWELLDITSTIEKAKRFIENKVKSYEKYIGYCPVRPNMNGQNSFTYVGNREDCEVPNVITSGFLGFVIEPKIIE